MTEDIIYWSSCCLRQGGEREPCMGEKTHKLQKYKTDAVNQMKEMIKDSKDLIFTDYRGLNVQQITDLRRHLREKEAGYKVIKNNYFKIALSELGLPFEDAFLVDPTALALVRTDVGPIARILFNFTRNSSLKVKGGMIEGKAITALDVEAISKLPGREQLYAKLMGAMNAPLKNMMQVMNGVVTKLARTLLAVADAKEAAGQ